MIRVRYFAAAAEAAGVDTEAVPAGSMAQVRSGLIDLHPALGAVVPRCALLVDGTRLDDGDPVLDGATLDVLPPFAGG